MKIENKQHICLNCAPHLGLILKNEKVVITRQKCSICKQTRLGSNQKYFDKK